MFPRIRILELEQETRQRREDFNRSSERFIQTIQKKIKPLQLLRDNPKLLLGAALAVLSGAKLIRPLLSLMLNKKTVSKLVKIGWLWPLAQLIGRFGRKLIVPAALHALRLSLKNSLK